jgi:hypothetical protein
MSSRSTAVLPGVTNCPSGLCRDLLSRTCSAGDSLDRASRLVQDGVGVGVAAEALVVNDEVAFIAPLRTASAKTTARRNLRIAQRGPRLRDRRSMFLGASKSTIEADGLAFEYRARR